jgi:hypothetical protein
MKDNFDLKKFLTENKTIENSNPFLKEAKEKEEKFNKSKIEKAIKAILKKEGGAAGLKPLVAAAKDLGADKKDLMGVLKKMTSVEKHRHGDYILKESEAGELNVYGYQTKHFDICPAATSLFKRILDDEFGDLSEIAVQGIAKIHDHLFLLEKKVIKKEQASKQQVNMAKMAQEAIITLGLQIGIPEEEFDYVQAHVDKIKSFSNLKEEMSDSEKEKVNREVDAVRDDLDQISKLAKDAGEDAEDIKSKIREMIINELSEEMDPEDEEESPEEKEKQAAIARSNQSQMDADEFEELAQYMRPFEESLDEAKEDEEEIETDESEDTEEAPEEEVEAEEEESETGGGIEDIAADMEGDEGDLMDHLISALKVSKAMDNDKLTTQIGNTLKFFVGEYIGGEE